MILRFRQLTQEALHDTLIDRIPFLLSSILDFHMHAPNGESPVSILLTGLNMSFPYVKLCGIWKLERRRNGFCRRNCHESRSHISCGFTESEEWLENENCWISLMIGWFARSWYFMFALTLSVCRNWRGRIYIGMPADGLCGGFHTKTGEDRWFSVPCIVGRAFEQHPLPLCSH